MNFRPELAQAVMAGRKTVTRRLVSDNPRSPWYRGGCSLKPGRTYAVCPGRGKHAIGRVEVVSVTEERLPDRLSDVELEREGFDTQEEFLATWQGLNGRRGASNPPVWRVEFRLEGARV